VNSLTISPSAALNGTTVTITANVTDRDGVSAVKAQVFYPNGTLWQTLTMTGSNPYTASITAPTSPLGSYSVVLLANDTSGGVNSGTSAQFAPYLAVSQSANIVIDGAVSEWPASMNFSDAISDASAANPFAFEGEFFGSDALDGAGQSVATGDFNKDGYADLVLGSFVASDGCLNASATRCGSGVVYLYNTTTGNFSFMGEFFGRDSNDKAGWSVATGDFNKDGYADFVLGAYQAEGGCLNASAFECGAGVVYLYNTTTGNFSYKGEFFGNHDFDAAGESVAVGDFNKDGYADFVLGAYKAGGRCLTPGATKCGSGVVYVYNATTGSFSYVDEFSGTAVMIMPACLLLLGILTRMGMLISCLAHT
jgi:hypothetical protein